MEKIINKNMNSILDAKKEIFFEWILARAKNDMLSIADKIKTGDFDLVDFKINIANISGDKILHKFIFLYIYLVDCYIIDKLHIQDIEFFEYILSFFYKSLGIKSEWSIWSNMYNSEIVNFGKYKEFINENKFGDTLFGEFGFQISEICTNELFKNPLIASHVRSLVLSSYVALCKSDILTANMFNNKEQEFLDSFKTQIELQEIGQAGELIQQCNNKYQFAKTHSVYVKDWEKSKLEMSKKIQSNNFSQTLSKEVANEMFKITEELTQEKLAMIRLAFEKKFGESIYNYIGKNGKTKKFLGIFG